LGNHVDKTDGVFAEESWQDHKKPLPLLSKKEPLVEIYFVPLESSQLLIRYKFSVVINGSINDLCAALEQINGVSKHHMTECRSSRIIYYHYCWIKIH
jgi:hypothetical protein